MSFSQAEGYRLLGFDARIDAGVVQCSQVGFCVRPGKVAFQRNRAAGKKLLDGLDVAFEQLGEVEFCRGAFDTWEQGSVKHDLETVVAHAGILVT